MILKIAQLGQPVLRQIAAEVQPGEMASVEFQQLIDNMLETLTSQNGAGLAGPQVFASKRVFLGAILPPTVENGPPGVEVFVNPKIIAVSEERAAAWEGCLSFPELLVLVPRYRALRVQYRDRQGQSRMLELQGFPARVVQHETDHLDGILTLDRAQSTKDIIKASEIDAVKEQTE
jgi:peptide deformylase